MLVNDGEEPLQGQICIPDKGPACLPYMKYFVQLVRKIQRPHLLKTWIEAVHSCPLKDLAMLDLLKDGIIDIASRNTLFSCVATLLLSLQHRLEQTAERVLLLCDEYGVLAVNEQIHPTFDATFLQSPADKFSRALYLYISQAFFYDEAITELRFERAEARQEMLRQGHSEHYSSHYLGPKGVIPQLDSVLARHFRQQLAALFPDVNSEEIVLEAFIRREKNDPKQTITLYTLKAMFNGAQLSFQKMINNEVIECDEAIITQVEYVWHPAKGALSIYCTDKEIRPALAQLFYEIFLDTQEDGNPLPLRDFNLSPFSTPAILERLKRDRINGIENISIQYIAIAKPHIQQLCVKGKTINRLVTSELCIRRHPFDHRNIYEIVQEDGKISDLADCDILKVKLSMRIAARRYRSTHNISFEIIAPNGINDRHTTEEDNELILAQLEKLGCLPCH